MSPETINDRLAVCSWSLQPESADQLIETMGQLPVKKIQLALEPLRNSPDAWADTGSRLADAGMEIVSGMFEGVGEDYSTPQRIAETGGVVPDETWPQLWSNIQQIVPIAKDLGMSFVTFHAGFLPHETSDPTYDKLKSRIVQIADIFADQDIEVGFETGQETASTLKDFLDDMAKDNIGVNFDPANMILYQMGDPIEALDVLGPYLKQCHIKDATETKVPGTWGDEVTVGTGQVDWPAFFAALDRASFDGYLAIEREAGDQRIADIKTAAEFVAGL